MPVRSSLAQHLVGHFSAIAEDYEERAAGLHAKAAERLVNLAAPRPKQVCLDVGTGTGLVARGLSKAVGKRGTVVGVDPTPAMLSQARRRPAPNLRYAHGWGEHLDFRDESFDLACFGDSLTYLVDPFAGLAEARRVLRPGGRIAVSVPRRSFSTEAEEVSIEALAELAAERGLTVPRQPDYLGRFGEPPVLVELLEEQGFEAVETTQLMSGFRAATVGEWLDLLEDVGPFSHELLSSMGPVMRGHLARRLVPRMRELGDEAYRLHHTFTLAVAKRA